MNRTKTQTRGSACHGRRRATLPSLLLPLLLASYTASAFAPSRATHSTGLYHKQLSDPFDLYNNYQSSASSGNSHVAWPIQQQRPLTARSAFLSKFSFSSNKKLDDDNAEKKNKSKTEVKQTTTSADSSSSSSSEINDASTSDARKLQPLIIDGTAQRRSRQQLSMGTAPRGSKLRRLKDLMWVREALEDATAAEFACTVEGGSNKVVDGEEDAKSRRRRAVDYEKLITQLNKRLYDLGCEGSSSKSKSSTKTTASKTTTASSSSTKSSSGGTSYADSLACHLQPGQGMGSIVYTDGQRANLLERLLRARNALIDVLRANELDMELLDGVDSNFTLPFNIQLPELPDLQIPKEPETDELNNAPGPKLYVRDDGTVDWDGALQDRAALRKFGTAVWARINGQDPDSIEDNDNDMIEEANPKQATALTQQQQQNKNNVEVTTKKEVTAKIEETPEIIREREKLNKLKEELYEKETQHTKLLSSAIQAGQAVANVRLASLEPEQRNTIRESAEALELAREKVSFQTLIYELERVYTYLLGEIGNPSLNGYIPLQDRLNVAEFGLLESQIDNFNSILETGEFVDTDVLAVVLEQLNDFKRRLGIDYYVTGLTFDNEGIKRWFSELADKTKKGLAFYVKGVQLFWNDILFCLSLINRAAQGYTLKPREVRTLRRTFKDIITFIPVVIILIIPLSPVGHVLVFGAIQRFFPDFFPSCFTEQRQNLLQLYETAEYSELTINENWREKLSRLTEALLFLATNASKALYMWLVALTMQKERRKNNLDEGKKET